MSEANAAVDHYLSDGCGRCKLYATPECKVHTWVKELMLLRELLLESELTEEYKWSTPTYTWNGKNVIILGAFKHYCCISFLKGSLMKDEAGKLEKPGENSQDGRIIRITRDGQVAELAETIVSYIREATEIEKAGLKPKKRENPIPDYPEELTQAMHDDPELDSAFKALTPGRQRGYIMFIAAAKQSATRFARIEKYRDAILAGKGMHD